MNVWQVMALDKLNESEPGTSDTQEQVAYNYQKEMLNSRVETSKVFDKSVQLYIIWVVPIFIVFTGFVTAFFMTLIGKFGWNLFYSPTDLSVFVTRLWDTVSGASIGITTAVLLFLKNRYSLNTKQDD